MKMTEYATIKQLEFMKKLGFAGQSAGLTKEDARRMISDKLEKNGMTKTEAKATPGAEESLEITERIHPSKISIKTENGKEYHLSPEEVRCRALEAALSVYSQEPNRAMEQADKFVEWIYDR